MPTPAFTFGHITTEDIGQLHHRFRAEARPQAALHDGELVEDDLGGRRFWILAASRDELPDLPFDSDPRYSQVIPGKLEEKDLESVARTLLGSEPRVRHRRRVGEERLDPRDILRISPKHKYEMRYDPELLAEKLGN